MRNVNVMVGGCLEEGCTAIGRWDAEHVAV